MLDTGFAVPAARPGQFVPVPPAVGGVYDNPVALVGNTPLLRVAAEDGGGRGYWAKLEGANPGGIKDRAALHMVRRARARGDLVPGAPIVESSSGTLALGLALAAMAYGHPLTVVADPGLEPPVRHLLSSYGAAVEIVPAPDPVGGWQEARRRRVRELLAAEPAAWCPDQYGNPDNVAAYEPLALELAHQLGGVDVLVCAVGTGGHSAGIFGMLRRLFPHARLVGVDATGSTIFGQPARPRLMRGLGSSIHPGNVAYRLFSEVHWVPPGPAVRTCRALARASYATGGWSVGAVGLVAGWLARTLPAQRTIVAVFPDGPHRYAETVFSDEYCAAHDLLAGEVPAEPLLIEDPKTTEAVAWSRSTNVRRPA